MEPPTSPPPQATKLTNLKKISEGGVGPPGGPRKTGHLKAFSKNVLVVRTETHTQTHGVGPPEGGGRPTPPGSAELKGSPERRFGLPPPQQMPPQRSSVTVGHRYRASLPLAWRQGRRPWRWRSPSSSAGTAAGLGWAAPPPPSPRVELLTRPAVSCRRGGVPGTGLADGGGGSGSGGRPADRYP